MKLPDFLVIGAEKSGTTWLKHVLREHPEIFVPSEKELHFFDRDENFDSGLEWYSAFFSKSDKIHRGEITPAYLASAEKVAPRIATQFPFMRLIAIIRNPVERAWSNYQMNKADGKVDIDFSECIGANHPIITKGHYAEQLSVYFDHFPKDQMLILNYDDLDRPAELIRRVFRFLMVDEGFVPTKLNERIFSARVARFPILNHVVRAAVRILRKVGLMSFFSPHKQVVNNILRRYNTRTATYQQMTYEQRSKLIQIYMKDILFLEQFWDISLDRWKR